MSGEDDAKGHEDVVVLQGPTEDGGGIRVVRARGGDGEKVEVGEVRPLREGQSVTGEVVSLHPRTFDEQGAPRLCDVKVLYSPSAPPGAETGAETMPPSTPRSSMPVVRARSGPAQVATDAYRESWEATFGTATDAKADRNRLN